MDPVIDIYSMSAPGFVWKRSPQWSPGIRRHRRGPWALT